MQMFSTPETFNGQKWPGQDLIRERVTPVTLSSNISTHRNRYHRGSPLSPQCSVTCGVGRTTRQVVCSNYHQPVDRSFCDPEEQTVTEQECTAAPCPSVHHRQRINDQPYGYPQDPGRHPGHSSWNVPSADNQWRTGPWGAVRPAHGL